MIYTVTLNPSLDYVMKLNDFEEGTVNRSIKEHVTPGGKGINVSRSLKALGIDTVATGFMGGVIGEYIEAMLKSNGIGTDFVKLRSESRINLKLEYDKETEVNASGPFISRFDFDELFKKLDRLVYGDFLVLSGSIGKGTHEEVYSDIMEHVKNKNVNVVVDTTGIPFIHTLKHRPFLVKPNLRELSEITNKNLKTTHEIIEGAKDLVNLGAKNVLVSLGEKGAILVTENEVLMADAPEGYVVTSVGAGDSMIAGFLYSIFRGESSIEALRSGVAAGSASVFSSNVITYSDFNKIYEEVSVEVIE